MHLTLSDPISCARRTTAEGWTMCSNCGSSRPASFQPRSATTANFVWTTCCMHAPPASPALTRFSGASTLNSTTCQPFATYAFIYTRRQTRKDARWKRNLKDNLEFGKLVVIWCIWNIPKSLKLVENCHQILPQRPLLLLCFYNRNEQFDILECQFKKNREMKK